MNHFSKFLTLVKVIFFMKYCLLQSKLHFAKEQKDVVISKYMDMEQTSIPSVYLLLPVTLAEN